MLALLVTIGYFTQEIMHPGFGHEGAIYALVIGSFLFLVSYYTGDTILLSSVGAHEIEKKDAPQLHNVVEEMVIASGLGAMPKIYVIESTSSNAFATGRAPAVSAVAVTEGLLSMCSRDELQAVIAHEIAHIKNRDILFMTLLSVMVGTISLTSNAVRRWFTSERQLTTRTAAATVGLVSVLRTGVILFAFGVVRSPPRSSTLPPVELVNIWPMPAEPSSQEIRARWPMRWRRSPRTPPVAHFRSPKWRKTC